jgi:hypothetical protein
LVWIDAGVCFVLFCFVLFCLTTCSCIECKLAHLFFSFHCACYCRVRSASVEVIEALVSAGADPDSRNMLSASVSPLTLVLLRGAASTATGARLIGAGAGTGEDMGGLGLSPPGHNNSGSSSRLTVDGKHLEMDNTSVGSAAAAAGGAGGAGGAQSALDPERTRVAGRRVWIRAAEALMKCGTYYIPLLFFAGCPFMSTQLTSCYHAGVCFVSVFMLIQCRLLWFYRCSLGHQLADQQGLHTAAPVAGCVPAAQGGQRCVS